MAVGRNEACPCGSGRKYKNCCIGNNTRGSSRGLLLLIAAIAVIGAIGIVPTLIGRKSETAATPVAAAPRANRTQPGPAPAGKVWSQEHGHWHDTTPGTPPAPTVETTQQRRNVPQPPGTPPPGKVWSAEHGHWHDVPKQ